MLYFYLYYFNWFLFDSFIIYIDVGKHSLILFPSNVFHGSTHNFQYCCSFLRKIYYVIVSVCYSDICLSCCVYRLDWWIWKMKTLWRKLWSKLIQIFRLAISKIKWLRCFHSLCVNSFLSKLLCPQSPIPSKFDPITSKWQVS